MSKAEHMGVSPSQLSCHAKSNSCPKQTIPERTHEFDAECKCSGLSEQKQQLGSEIIQTEPGETGTAASECGANVPLQPTSENVTKNVVTDDLEPASEEACLSSLIDASSRAKSTVINRKLEFGSADVNGLLGAACEHSIPSKEKDQLALGLLQNEPKGSSESSSYVVNEKSQQLLEDMANNSFPEDLGQPHEDASKGSQIDKSPCNQQTISGQTLEFPSLITACESSEKRQKPCSDPVLNQPVETATTLPIHIELFEPHSETVTKTSPVEININAAEQLGPPHNDVHMPCNLKQLETSSKDVLNNSGYWVHRVKRSAKSSRKTYMLRSLVGSDRVLRPRSREKSKAPGLSSNLANVDLTGEKKSKVIEKRRGKIILVDEYSRIRKDLRYLLNRMNYEQSLINAYSAEGWKGLSLEKLKPEKELQRASSEIFRRKLKIRDLFQRIDLLCAEGRLPADSFDSEGQISSEDIFCAKCGSKDLITDDDIILCDGACDRGFHQFCLVPPLLKEEIPPDDEGWLCPGCDCKVDCVELLNDSQGTKLSINDNWEKVFPEAAAAASGQNLDHNSGLSSDDSDDNDYNPDGPDINEKSQEDDSSSDGSDFTSASDELAASADDEQYLGLPSDDPEDDDYDPDAPGVDEKVKKESSSSDFTSDSEDLVSALDGNEFSVENGATSLGPHRDSDEQRSKLDGKKKLSLNSELSSILEDCAQDGSAPVSVKRNVERLDYKKLHDETYGSDSSDSNDDEDYTDAAGPRKRRRRTREFTPVSSNDDASMTRTGLSDGVLKKGLKKTQLTPKRRTCQKSIDTKISPAKADRGSLPSSSSKKSSTYKRLGESVTQRLHKSFREDQYPSRATKESLAKELEITYRQVCKWFENARWSFNHPSPMDPVRAKTTSVLEKDSPGPSMVSRAETHKRSEESPMEGVVLDTEGEKQEGIKQKSGSPEPRRRKRKSGQRTRELRSEDAEMLLPNSSSTQRTQTGVRMTRRRNSVA